MAHPAQSARKGNNYVPNDYRPFQCCPTKLERQTRVPKMSAQKLSHKKDSNEKKTHKSQFEFGSSSDGGSKKHEAKIIKASPVISSTPSPSASSSSKRSSSSTSSNTATSASRSKKSRNDDDDDDDDDVPVKDIKKSSKSKETNKPKPGQKGLLGIAKIVNWF